MFVAAEIRRFTHVGMLGGAAKASKRGDVSSPPLSEEQNVDVSPTVSAKNLGLFPFVVGVLALGVTALLSTGSFRKEEPKLPPEMAATVAQAEALLFRDDAVSLEQALALFTRLAETSPDLPEISAWRALATTLLGEALASEAEDWQFGLSVEGANLVDAKPRVAVVEPRARRLLVEGKRLAIEAWSQPGMAERVESLRAVMLSFANERSLERVVEMEEILTEADRNDPWIRYARERAEMTTGTSEHFLKTLGVHSEFERALWQKGRGAMLAVPARPDEARTAFNHVLQTNKRHEGARRGLALLEAAALR